MRKFEKEFRLQHPQTIGETDKDFDNHNYTEFLESVLEKMAEPKEEQPEKIVSELKQDKLIHQLFIGKVSDIIGFEKATALLKESIDAFKTK